MDFEKMNLDELNALIKTASAVKERKIRAKDVKWKEFSKAWDKLFKEYDDKEIGIGDEHYTLSEIFGGLERAFWWGNL